MIARLLLTVVVSATSLVPTFSSDSISSAKLLDLSYLFRTPVSSIAGAIQEFHHDAAQKEYTPTTTIHENSSRSIVTIDVDLTSSLIDKNVTVIIEALRSLKQRQQENAQTTTTVLRLTTRRNQWTARDAIAMIEFLMEDKERNLHGRPSGNTEAKSFDSVKKYSSNDSKTVEIVESTIQNSLHNNEKQDHPTNLDDNTTFARCATSDHGNSTVIESSENISYVLPPNARSEEEMLYRFPPPSPPSLWLRHPTFVVHRLDLGWNHLFGDPGNIKRKHEIKALNQALQQLIANKTYCPEIIKLDVCGVNPSTCRAIAKGLLHRFHAGVAAAEDDNDDDGDLDTPLKQSQDYSSSLTTKMTLPSPISLSLACNGGIGDAGVAALAAAIRTVAAHRQRNKNDTKQSNIFQPSYDGDDVESISNDNNDGHTVLNSLDLSACSISDAGVEALAIALENYPMCVKHLDLSKNHITDQGAIALARALRKMVTNNNRQKGQKIQTLNLSYNSNIGDRGAKELAVAVQEGCIQNMILRSCHVHADGAAAFGTALRALAGAAAANPKSKVADWQRRQLLVDLSGNPIGLLRKKPKSGYKYSASALKSKASETTAAYMDLIGKTVQKRLKDLGLTEGNNGLDTLESDDEEENRMEKGTGDNGDDESKNTCGAIAFAQAFIKEEEDEKTTEQETAVDGKMTEKRLHIILGLRHCALDTRAAEALAAVLHESRKKPFALNLTMDVRMNHVLEDNIIAGLNGDAHFEDQISEMAERFLDAMDVIRESKERALEAARIARTKARARAELADAWGSPVGVGSTAYELDEDEGNWDSDADYDVLEEDEDAHWS